MNLETQPGSANPYETQPGNVPVPNEFPKAIALPKEHQEEIDAAAKEVERVAEEERIAAIQRDAFAEKIGENKDEKAA